MGKHGTNYDDMHIPDTSDWAGPIGFRLIETAPRDGTFIRLRFRPGCGRENLEAVGQWQEHDEMPTGGSWFDRQGNYITPGPLFWAPPLKDRTDPEGGTPGRQL